MSTAKTLANRRNASLSTGPRTDAGKATSARNATAHGIFAAAPVVPGETAEAWEAHRTGVVESLAPVGGLERNLAERVALLLWRLHRLARYETESIAAAVDGALLPPVKTDADELSVTPSRAALGGKLRKLRGEIAKDHANAIEWAQSLAFFENASQNGEYGATLDRVDAVFGYVGDFVCGFERPKVDPPAFEGRSFRKQLGLPDAPPEIAWTADLVRRAFEMYAGCIGLSLAQFTAGVRHECEAQIRDHARALKQKQAAAETLERRLAVANAAARADALLPVAGREERIAKYERHLHQMLTSTLHELARLQARRAGEPVVPPAVADLTVSVSGVPT